MHQSSNTQPPRALLQHLLDAFATRVGTLLTVGLGCGLCLCAGLYFQFGANRLLASHEMFRQAQMRDSFVTISDMARLTLIVEKIVLAGEPTPELSEELLRALDILYVRADAMRSRETANGAASGLLPPSELIFSLVEFVDDTLATTVEDWLRFEFELLEHVEAARGQLVNFQDTMRRLEDRVLDAQAAEVNRQANVMGVAFVLLGLIVSCALVLLRKEILARQARNAAEDRARYLAFFDPLTGLPNRVQFTDDVEERLGQAHSIAIMVIDLDDFKGINDTHGHAAGDTVLRAVGAAIAITAAAWEGVGARLSGDEFALCLPAENTDMLAFVADDLLERLGHPVPYEGGNITPAGSIGIAASAQVARTMKPSFSNLMRAGDFALYAAKEGGKGSYALYNDALEAEFNARRGMLADLERAIAAEDLMVYLQPKVQLPEGRPYGFEALVRWQRDSQSVPPDIFISLAEEMGMVTAIDLFVLNRATQQVAQQNALSGSALSVSVNLSALHFNTSNIVSEVEAALARSGLPPELLTLEVTETVQIQDWERVRLLLGQLSGLGCKISIDDFGSGYSSLAYLRNMVADELKVDRSLIEDITTSPESQSVLRAIYDLGTGLGMRILVEGIETEAQSLAIQAIGCQAAQGYLYGKPEPAEQAIRRALALRGSDHGTKRAG